MKSIKSKILAALGLLCSATTAAIVPSPKQDVINSAANPGTIIAALKEAFVIPDVLPEEFEPVYSIELTYTAAHETVRMGNIIRPENATSKPVLQISPLYGQWSPSRTSPSNKTYTLVLSDPDATSHAKPVKGQMCHWIATGIQPPESSTSKTVHEFEPRSLSGPDADALDLSEVVEYLPPSPPPKTGFHRYVFVLLEPETPEDNSRKLKKPKDRARWGFKKQGKGVMKWAKKNRLVPIAANYFLAQNKKQ